MKRTKNIKIELSEKEKQKVKDVFKLVENIMEIMENENLEILWAEYGEEFQECLQTKDLQETLETLKMLAYFKLSIEEAFNDEN